MRYADVPSRTPISKIGLGTWQFGSREWGYGSDYESRVDAIVTRALEVGITLFDSAEAYAFGRSERLLGAALGDARERAFVATKIFPILPVSGVVQQRAVASAARLGVRTIDLYQVHQPNPVVRDGTTMAGMRRLQDVGIVDHVGVSNYSLGRWQRAEQALGRPVLSNQVQYSLARTAPEEDLLPYAAQRQRLLIAYSPPAQGFLSGRGSAGNLPPGGVVGRDPAGRFHSADEPALPAGEPRTRRTSARHPPRGRGRARPDAVAARAGLRRPPPPGRGDPRRLERRAGRGQCGRSGRRARRRRVRRPALGGTLVQRDHRSARATEAARGAPIGRVRQPGDGVRCVDRVSPSGRPCWRLPATEG